jgi:cysteinyl-tRNA synthetase
VEHVETVLRAAHTDGADSRAPGGADGGIVVGEGRRAATAEQAAAAARDAFEAAMDEDFNTPRALAAVFELATSLNRAADAAANSEDVGSSAMQADLRAGIDVLRTLAGVLGLSLRASITPEQRVALHRLARDLAREQPDLFDAAHPVLKSLRAETPEEMASGEDLVGFIAEGRMRARRRKDWTTADAIRSRLQAVGVLLEDSPTGYQWRLR